MKDKIKESYKQSKNIYDDVLTQSKWWSKLYIRLFWGVDDIEIAEKLFHMLPDNFNGSLLDVPCGTLNLTASKYAQMKNAAITCLDYSEDMLSRANQRIEQGLPNIAAVQGDVDNLPFENDTFDMVLSMNGFHAFPRKDLAYAETARVLKPGGQFLGCFYVKGEYKPSDFVVNTVLAKKGWFTPLFQTKEDVWKSLKRYYSSVELDSDKAMVWFRCIK